MSKNNNSTIEIEVELDENKHPENIRWTANNNGTKMNQNAKAMLLSFFDRDTLETMKIDLWTNDLQVNEMDRFVFHTLRAIGETYFKATKNNQLANDFQRFVHYFGEQTEIIPKEEN